MSSVSLNNSKIHYCGALHAIVFPVEEEFQQLQQSFMEKHYLEFDDSDENKLSYTPIFNEYVSCLYGKDK